MEASQSDLMSALAALYDAGKYSDLVIRCNQRKFNVHRAVLCSRSNFFDAVASNPFKESLNGEVDLSEDDAEAVENMVYYFYHLDYLCPKRKSKTSPFYRRQRSNTNRSAASWQSKMDVEDDPLIAAATAASQVSAASLPSPPEESYLPGKKQRSPSPRGRDEWISRTDSITDEDDETYYEEDDDDDSFQAANEPQLIAHAKVYAIAEKYGISALKRLSKEKFELQLSRHYDSNEFADALYEVYEGTPDSDRALRSAALQAFREHPSLALKQDVEATIKDIAPLAFDLYKVASGLPL